MAYDNQNADRTIFLDRQVGAHCLFDSWTTELQTKGVIETISGDYPRYVKMFSQANFGIHDYCQADKVCELRACTNNGANLYTLAITDVNGRHDNGNGIDFSILPMIAVNKIQGGNVSYNQTGYIKMTCVHIGMKNILES